MVQFKNPTTGVTVQQENRSIQDLSNQGFTEQIADIAPVVTNVPVVEPAPVTNVVEEPQVFNRGELIGKLDETYKSAGAGALANEAFIQGAAKAKFGRSASAEELGAIGTEFGLMGATTEDVLKRFGLQEELSNFGVEPKPEEAIVSGPQGVEDTIAPTLSAIDDLVATKQAGMAEGVDTQAFLEEKQQRAIAVEEARQAIADKKLLDAVEIEAIGDKPISMTSISRQQNKFSQDEYINNLKMAQDYNNKLILSQIAQGNFLEAQNINQSIASDNFQIESLKIDRAVEQNRIDENEATLLRQEEQTAFERAEAGYIQITDPKMLETLTEDQIIRAGGKIYRRPVEAEAPLIDPTTDYKNWVLAGGQEGSGLTFTEWQGKQKEGEDEPQEQSEYMKKTADMTLQTINELLPQVSGDTTGWGAFFKGKLPGSDARSFAAQLDTLKGNIGFGALTAMREASKTGGALGQVSDREIKLLTSTLGALDQMQTAAQFTTQLNKIKESVERWNTAVAENAEGGDYSW